MDFARKIGKEPEPRTWKKIRQPLVTTKDNLLSEDTSFSEDRGFINWKKWLADRKKQNRYIEFVTGRSQDEQLQNSSEKFRSFIEMKNLMEHAAIPIVTDKYRGRPEFWKMPEFLPDRGDACLPEVSLTLSKKDLTSDLMHVGLPDLIAKERDLATQKKEKFWKRSEYLKTRKLELAEKIALLMPKEPEMATLAIQGHAYQKKKLPLLRKPPITIETSIESEDDPHEDADEAVILKIQDREFVWQKSLFRPEPVDTDPIIWSLTFTSKSDEQIEKEIVLENKGTRVIEYHWRYSPFRTDSIFFEKHGSQFFFNKTKELILPGQIVKIKVWYRSKTCGVFTEYWRFITDPKLSSSTFIFRFWGYTIDTQNIELIDHQMIDEYLNRCIRDSTIRSIIKEILDRVEHSEPPEPPYKMLISQKELFASLNSDYHYHPNIVMQLQRIYSDVTDESTSTWNLSLDSLRDILLQIEDTNYKRDMLTRFNELCKQSLRPRLFESDVEYYNKYDAVYNILCAFANLFENESELVKRNSLIQEEPTTPIKVKQKLTPLFQRSNNSLREVQSKTLNDQPESTVLVQEENKSFGLNLQLYREIFFIRIYKALEEAIERVCASIDSFHRLNELKFKI
ncbi:MYCBP-associated protein [Trachymyrmex septentrionalis]|uniref:MYCBP-associated protein n=1 Tax=Trachymyrmex septentrionalis TaxID=34720 RepID=A0A151JZF8_9HYME|nr:PREDICTED: MYCBP-associated protein-like [Trachymyrmex septentrionalis]KYN42385.1 MYCBP-associated protein [Trachymyrmex septentrionalis]